MPSDGHFLEFERPLLREPEEEGFQGSGPPPRPPLRAPPHRAHRPAILPGTGGFAVEWLR